MSVVPAMRLLLAATIALSMCRLAAAEPPVLGLWEQLPVGDGSGGVAAVPRVDLVFTDRRIDGDTRFSGLVDSGSRLSVLCCVELGKGDETSLPALLKRHAWDRDTAEHLRGIKGWHYVYEARLVESGARNPRMRKLVADLAMPPALSPYSAAVIAAPLPAAEIEPHFQAGGASIVYRLRTSPDKQRVLHGFSIDGGPVTFSEDNFPD
ncbi:hypothetical protein F3J11_17155 [Burkholderia sp. Cy-647]|uniref:hypothetical protein n=1 Tax=unclassified Burkholderia TaxID=2613784 RepID=UPI001422A41F|nr:MULTISPECIES: hypothetical protein [unclassified Burkholderia]NIF64398.1 hypothetical protein [Burkholderia sp. Cy-647]NIF89036.1 hypothetical protein [Burkholderia sp. Cy-637]NIF99465.1 hypothetical protein [Burkholderia sp. Ax-1720]